MSRDLPAHVQTAIDKALKGEAQRRGRVVRGSVKNVSHPAGQSRSATAQRPWSATSRRAEGDISAAPPIAKGRIAKPRGMNRLESEYQGHLFARRSVGEVLWYGYEVMTLKLADDCRFTPDFMVLLKDGEIEAHETKGPHAREDSIIKLRVAARLFPFRFYLVTREGDGWKTVEVKA